MSQEIDPHPSAVKFFNSHLVSLNSLHTKAFYGSHMCLMRCYTKDSTERSINACSRECQKDLDDYFQQVEEKRPYEKELWTLASSEGSKAEEKYGYLRSTAVLNDNIRSYMD